MLSNRKDTSLDERPRVETPASDPPPPPPVSQMVPLWPIYTDDGGASLVQNPLLGSKSEGTGVIFSFKMLWLRMVGAVSRPPPLDCSLGVCRGNVGSTRSVCVRHL